jgi:rare lipoprotein A
MAAVLALAACSETKLAVHTAKQINRQISAKPEPGATKPATAAAQSGIVKIGKPYEVAGVWYYPKADAEYDETGIASWYGQPFHGRSTANGERFDMNALSAAHKTLPLPSLVRVTNLQNGRSLQIRVNDRGPFVHGRIIDVSRRAAQLLGFERAGTARVRVEAAGQFIAKPVTTEEERTMVAAVPQEPISAEPLPAPGQKAPQKPPPQQAAPAPPAPAEPVVTLVPVRPTQLFVQAGAFTFMDNARRLKTTLARIGPTKISAVNVDGKDFYRVRVGPLQTVETADATLEQVIESGFPGARIVVD